MDIFSIIAEDKIKRAIAEGEFDDLPGKGKPLKLEDLSHIPEDLRIAYKVMKNANMLEDVDKIKEELLSLDDLLATCDNLEERVKLKKKKHEKELRLEQLLNKRKILDAPASAFYKEKINEKLTK
ncbi:DnaJ family domain-containing protein [Metabacillus niabensis]|uniref:DnaJ homologue subfamily C member 28 conserved domain-containing protein n=1 Tax=Metabacillus niabensis TaxID=324854 RepID=A0ABT9Z2L3_9BACI|nr:DUF1992 domain-containing protein [Metabacillus niabensis]MDQ0226494.1 hypothetical protein [Metabacillus niabensis]